MINPVVFSGMIQRTQDVSTIKQNENVKPQFEQVFVQQQNQTKVLLKKIMQIENRKSLMQKKKVMESILQIIKEVNRIKKMMEK